MTCFSKNLWGSIYITLMISACVATPEKATVTPWPDWIIESNDGNGDIYGVGSANVYVDISQARKLANDKAIIDMVSKLKVQISAETTQSTQQIIKDGQSRIRKDLSQKISAKVEPVELFEVEQRDTYFDESNQLFYVLVYMDRQKVAMQIQQQIEDLNIRLAEYLVKPVKPDALLQLQQLLKGLPLIEQQANLQKRYHLVTGKNADADTSPAQWLDQQIQDQLDALKVAITPMPAQIAVPALEGGLNNVLNEWGLTVVNNTETAADLNIRYYYSADTSKIADTYYVLASTRLQFADQQGRVTMDVRRDAKGVSSLSGRAVESAIKKVVKSVRGDISDFFSGNYPPY